MTAEYGGVEVCASSDGDSDTLADIAGVAVRGLLQAVTLLTETGLATLEADGPAGG